MNICLHSSAASIDFLQVHACQWLLGMIYVMIFLNHLNISILILFGMGIWPVGKV